MSSKPKAGKKKFDMQLDATLASDTDDNMAAIVKLLEEHKAALCNSTTRGKTKLCPNSGGRPWKPHHLT